MNQNSTAGKTLCLSVYFVFLLSIHTLYAQNSQNAVLDLRNHDFKENPVYNLHGSTWEFYWEQLLTPTDFINNDLKPTGFVNSHESWEKQLDIPAYGYGTYRIKILKPSDLTNLGVSIGTIPSSSKIFINGKLQGEIGKVGTNKDTQVPDSYPEIFFFDTSSSEVEIIIQVSNFYLRKAGLLHNYYIGTAKGISKKRESNITIEIFLAGAILIMGLYHVGLYFQSSQFKSALTFGVLCISMSIRIITTGELNIGSLDIIPWSWVITIEYLTFYIAVPLVMRFSYEMFPEESSKPLLKIINIISIAYILSAIFLPTDVFTILLAGFQILTLIAGFYFIYVLIKAFLYKRKGAFILLLGFIGLFATTIYDILAALDVVPELVTSPYGLLSFIFSQASLLSSRFTNSFIENKTLARELDFTNKNLEALVEEKTVSLRETNTALTVQNDNVRNSIQYAKRIQEAILPPQEDISSVFPNSFIFFKPRDIVSGDFYYFHKRSQHIIFAAADCTGHGVPGAFMSLISNEIIGQIVNVQGITLPDIILRELHLKIRKALKQKESNNRDGMDIALCTFNSETQKLHFSGAKRPLYYIEKNEELKIIKGDKHAIGGEQKEEDRIFKLHTIEPKDGCQIFLSSDGYQDQFGGTEGRKFMVGNFKNLLFEIAQEESPENQYHKITSTFDHWKGTKHKQIDDILVMGIRF